MKDKLKNLLVEMKDGQTPNEWIRTVQTVVSYFDLTEKLDENEKDLMANIVDWDSFKLKYDIFLARKEALMNQRKVLQAELKNLDE